MTRQEEVREGVARRLAIRDDKGFLDHQTLTYKITVEEYEWVDRLLSYLHFQGVVIRVEKEPPLIFLKDAEEHDTKWAESNFTDSLQEFGKETQRNMFKAGYTAIEPLIKRTE